MISINEFIQQNKNEAFEIVNSAGGRIDFVKGIDESDNWDGDITEQYVPWVVLVPEETLLDTAVLAVRSTENQYIVRGVLHVDKEIEFLAYDNESKKCIGWLGQLECVSCTENDIYTFIGEWQDKNKKRTPKELAEGLVLMLGEIQNELNRDGDEVTIDEVNELYNLASELNALLE